MITVRLNAGAIQKHMAINSLSQNELSRQLGISPSFLSQMLVGTRRPSPKKRQVFLNALGGTFHDGFLLEEASGEPYAADAESALPRRSTEGDENLVKA